MSYAKEQLAYELEQKREAFAKQAEDYRALFQNEDANYHYGESFLRLASSLRGSGKGIFVDADELKGDLQGALQGLFSDDDIDDLSEEIDAFKANISHKCKEFGIYIDTSGGNFGIYDDAFDGFGPGPYIIFDDSGHCIKSQKLTTMGYLSYDALFGRLETLYSTDFEELLEDVLDAADEDAYLIDEQDYEISEEEFVLSNEREPTEDDVRTIGDFVPPEIHYDMKMREQLLERLGDDLALLDQVQQEEYPQNGGISLDWA